MVGFGPADVPPTAAVKFIGAGTAACIADLVTFPLDTAKVRLQVRVYKMMLFPAAKMEGVVSHKWSFLEERRLIFLPSKQQEQLLCLNVFIDLLKTLKVTH